MDGQLSFVAGDGGWFEITVADRDVVYVRFALNPDQKTVRIAELRFVDPDPEAVRRISLTRIERAANANAVVMFGFAIGHTRAAPVDVPAYFKAARRQKKAAEAAGRYLLERPTGRRLDDSFFVRVARAYRHAVAAGLNPRQTLAADSGSAPDTVARWIGEARRRGHLPPTRPGKVTADAREEKS